MKNKMSVFWILIFSTMYLVEPGRSWVSAQSPTEPPVYQPDKELSVEIGDSATLRCCVSEKVAGIIEWFKQPNRKQPQIMVSVFKNGGETFYKGFQKSHFLIKRSSNCCNLTILKIIRSDQAVYYCSQMRPLLGFGDGTYLKIKGDHVTDAPETSTPALFAPTPHDSTTTTNITTQENTEPEVHIRSLHWTVLGLGSAFCAIIIFCLTCFLLTRRKCKRARVNASTADSQRAKQEAEDEMLNYTALKFSKRKAKPEKKKTGTLDECVYSDVKKR